MALYEEDMFDDLAYDEAEGAADAFGDGFDEYDEFDDSFDEFDEYDEFDAMDSYDEYDEFDAYDEADEFDEFEEGFDEDALDSMLAYSLASEEGDEFFGKLFSGLKKVASKVGGAIRKAAPVVGKIARVAAPILSKIPLPQAQMAAQAAKLLGRLRMEGATEEEALEAFAEAAAHNPRMLPIVATIGARSMLKGTGKRMSLAARKKAVHDVKTAARTLMQGHGKTAVRALPKIVRSAKKMAARKGTPKPVSTAVVKAAARRVAASPVLTRKLARPSMTAVQTVRHAGVAVPTLWGPTAAGPTLGRSHVTGRSFVIPGPARITISAA